MCLWESGGLIKTAVEEDGSFRATLAVIRAAARRYSDLIGPTCAGSAQDKGLVLLVAAALIDRFEFSNDDDAPSTYLSISPRIAPRAMEIRSEEVEAFWDLLASSVWQSLNPEPMKDKKMSVMPLIGAWVPEFLSTRSKRRGGSTYAGPLITR